MKEQDLKIINSIKELQKELKGKDVGLVPTMGALHDGHLSLISRCVRENEFSVVSVFVNPAQFGPSEDFDKYPRTLEADGLICENAGVDLIFAPDAKEMYPDGLSELTLVCPPYSCVDKLCGKSRPGHFDGVATVVSKLFNIVKPSRAYFGEKDAQQLFIIQKMVRDLNFDIEIIPCEIVREPDGLAMSSRNTYLTPEGRVEALRLNKALGAVKGLFDKGERSSCALTDAALSILGDVDLEYFEIVDLNTFEKIDTIANSALALVAVNIYQDGSKVRLIDNIRL